MRMLRTPLLGAAILAAVGLAACTGTIGDGDDDAANGKGQSAICGESPAPGATPLRRLTSDEYANTVRDLFGGATDPGNEFPATLIDEGFRSYADANIVSSAGADGIMRAAELVAGQVSQDASGVMGCDPAEAACAESYIADLARRAYRRPATDDELAILQSLWDGAVSDGFDATERLGMLVETILQSPQFLYRAELSNVDGAPVGEATRLNDHELASRLSYLFWDTMPDDELMALADAGELSQPEVLEAQARRLFADPRARVAIGRFVEDWIELYRLRGATRDLEMFPNWGPELAASIEGEVQAFVGHVIWEMDGKLETLLSAPVAMVDGPLASVYDVSGPTAAGDYQAMDMDPSQRAGLITTTAFMASHANEASTNPVQRGAFVRSKLFCQILHAPDDVMIEPLAPAPGQSKEDKLAEHRDNPACSGCHELMDPIGFGLENYDAIGAWRTVDEQGITVDPAGELAAAGEVTGPFEGGVDLAGKIATSQDVQACVVLQAFRFAAGREETEADSCSVSTLETLFDESGGDLGELLVGMIQTDAFRYRIIPEGLE